MDKDITLEPEKKMRFFGANAEEIYRNRYNIFIGISISNKKLTPDMALNYLKWAIHNAKKNVSVVIADELNIINYRLLDKYSKTKSEKRAKVVGDYFENMFRKAMEKLPSKDKHKVVIYRWNEIKRSDNYLKLRNFVEEKFREDSEFKSTVLYFIKKYIRKKGRSVSDDKLDKLATYILGELPTLIQGIKINDIHYNLCLYPTYSASGMSQFIMDIHNKDDIGQKLKNLITEKAVLVEAWLD